MSEQENQTAAAAAAAIEQQSTSTTKHTLEETTTEHTEQPEGKKQKTDSSESKTPAAVVSTSTAASLPESQDPKDVLKQVEFYFSDQNLPNDKFLWKATQNCEGGWVPIATILAFKRMARFKKFSADEIAAALKSSKDLLEVSEDNLKVRRQKSIVEPKKEERQEQFARTIYAKGFGDETSNSQFEIEKFFEKFGDIKQVRLRRNDEKLFKGSVFVEFSDLEDAQKFVNLDPKPKFDESELVTMSKQAYVEMKQAEHGFVASANGKRPRKFNAFREKGRK